MKRRNKQRSCLFANMMREFYELQPRTLMQLPGVHEGYEVLLPLLTQDWKDLFCLGVQHLALMCNLVC